jgi:hypothetical protein
MLGLALLATLALVDGAWLAAGVLAAFSAGLGILMLRDCMASCGIWARAAETLQTSIENEG